MKKNIQDKLNKENRNFSSKIKHVQNILEYVCM
jgi:hypothetical protein